MTGWTKRQRLQAVINGEPADKPPVSAWRHFTDCENDAKKLASALINFQRTYDWDFVKINPRAVYYHEVWGNQYDYSHYNGVVPTCTKKTIESFKDLEKITEKSIHEKPFMDQYTTIKMMREELGQEVPLLQTVFTPIGVLLNLCGARSLGRYRESPRDESPLIKLISEDPKGVHRVLKSIANTLARYVEETLKAGADGAFYAGLGMAREGYMTLAEWEEFVYPYDMIVLEALKSAPTIFHTCGIYANPQRFVDYPINILHWAESAPGNPSIADSVNWIGNKAVMGGVDERLFGTNAAEEILKQAEESVKIHKGRPFILAPECSVAPSTLDCEFKALRGSVAYV